MTATDNEVYQAEDVCDKDENKHNIEHPLPRILAPGHVLSRFERGIESLILRVRKGRDSSGVVPPTQISESVSLIQGEKCRYKAISG